jgi:3-hydroxyisobutyrate dehydrogenase-like beta-hydroxyacid dehydrogenase
MSPVVAIVAPGNMGAAVGRRLTENGVRVLTTLAGRGAASVARAVAAGMTDVALDRLVEAEIVLSILPPAQALSFAEQMAPLLLAAERKPVFVDCNAVSPETVRRIGVVVAATGAGASFVDASIIGLPPKPGQASPHIYVCGERAARARVLILGESGLDVRVLDGAVGAASALKMSYAGINKGVAALASAMILAAARSGATEALYQELSESLPGLLESLRRQVPDMLPKAYRWVAEMREIAAFAGEDAAARKVFEGFSELFERVSRDVAGEQVESGVLTGFFESRQ